jgi:hypothetical protein
MALHFVSPVNQTLLWDMSLFAASVFFSFSYLNYNLSIFNLGFLIFKGYCINFTYNDNDNLNTKY